MTDPTLSIPFKKTTCTIQQIISSGSFYIAADSLGQPHDRARQIAGEKLHSRVMYATR